MSTRVRRVACGLSGGVDSTVAAAILRKKGYEVIGTFMRNWDIADETGHCSADKDAEDAERVAKRLGIRFREVNLVKDYWQEVFEPLVADYQDGKTPNPDILCNSKIKFERFHRMCLETIGCDAVATGHYARTSFGEDLEYSCPRKAAKLLKAEDRIKDQTFFLSQVPQEALRKSMFPVGGIPKPIVKKIAVAEGFADIAAKKESMGICFIGKRRNGFQKFISEYVSTRPGDIVELESGRVLGRHNGVHLWTLGQKLSLGGQKDKLYVAGKDASTATLTACYGADHLALFCEHFFAGPPHWISGSAPDALARGDRMMPCEFRFQNTRPLSACVVSVGTTVSAAGNWEDSDDSKLTVSAVEPQKAVTPGQFVVFYTGDECLGSAVIQKTGPSLHTINAGKVRTETTRSN